MKFVKVTLSNYINFDLVTEVIVLDGGVIEVCFAAENDGAQSVTKFHGNDARRIIEFMDSNSKPI